MDEKIFQALFLTEAIRVCEEDTPFWYTSGKIGPLYCNTHFLFGSEAEANSLLSAIEKAIEGDRLLFPKTILDLLLAQYEKNEIFRMVTDKVVENAAGIDCDFISGGARRDFFFSILPAFFLKKPHLSIFKDETSVYSTADFSKSVNSENVDLSGKKALHIVDLITEATSYTRAWLPVVRNLGAKMENTITVVDRKQGGTEILEKEGVRTVALIDVNIPFFEAAKDRENVDSAQFILLKNFLSEPERFMPDFLFDHPDFIEKQIALGGKAKERALLAIEMGFAKGL